jgi:hypothetical protein
LFLDGTALDWYDTNHILLEDTTWQSWRKDFDENFATKGWMQSKYAVNYKYMGGSISEYTRKKLKFLAEENKSLPEEWRILLIIAGLPDHISNKIKRSKIKTVNELVIEVNQLDKPSPSNLQQKHLTKNNKKETINNAPEKPPFQSEFRPCRNCEKAGKPGRFHPEAKCTLKQQTQQTRIFTNITPKTNNTDRNFRVTNNTEIEEALNKDDVPKN